ncbi:cytochrome P450 [Bipolaris maydis]|nr:cytochrome P450 [Bipolaris maydis]KAJ5062932.1 cytochrome P450 [Bipolaris maydis]KAJ6199202.1 cytochrome P450 [Bipolaris maydis]KAJ6203897.1 cytochrome P450 [Bipolaris maydis]
MAFLIHFFITAVILLTHHYFLSSTMLVPKTSQKRTPPWLSYRLPLIGHAIYFLTDPYALLAGITHPVRLHLPGTNPILIQGTHNIRRLLKSSSHTNPSHAQTFIASQLFGMPKRAAQLFQQDDSGYAATPLPGSRVEGKNRICYRDRKILLDMLQGSEVAGVIDRFKCAFEKRMMRIWEDIAEGKEWVEESDLWEFLTREVTPAAIEALCGRLLVDEVDGEFASDFWSFDEWVPAITKGAPAWFFPGAYRVRDKLLGSLVEWRRLLLQRRRQQQQGSHGDEADNASPSMMAKMDLLDVDGWSVQAIAASDLGLIWASNSNTISAIYWLNVEIFRSRERLRRIRAECLNAGRTTSSHNTKDSHAIQGTPLLDFDLSALLTQPYLQACFAETLRLRTHIFITRFVDTRDMEINEWSIPAGSVLLTCSSVPHLDAALWKTNSHAASAHPLTDFVPERFLKMPIDISSNGPERGTCKLDADASPSVDPPGKQPPDTCPTSCESDQMQFSAKGLDGIYVPFGGGAQMCPGRKLAKAETFIVTTVLTSLFDIELCDPRCEMPVKSSHFGTGVSKPAAKTPFRIRRRQTRAVS